MKILIVDDDADGREMLRIVFEHDAFEVETASDGINALEKLEQSMPDVIITDVLMPRMDGFALCRHCKADPHYRNIPVIFLTATYLDAKDRDLARDLGVERYLTKPQLPEELTAVVREIVIGKREVVPAALSETEYQRMHEDVVSRKLRQKIDELENVNAALQRDIAMRRRTEAALRNSEARFRNLTTQAPVGIFEADLRGHCTFVNRRWCEIARCTPADALGRWWADGVLAADRERIAAFWATGNAMLGPWSTDLRFAGENGSLTWVHGTVVPVYDETGTLTGYLGTGLDITGRKKIEDALQQSEERFRILVNSMDDVVFTLDREQRHTGVYGGWLVQNGFTPDYFLGKTARELMGEAAAVHEAANKRVLTGAVVSYEWSSGEGDERRYYHTVLSPIWDPNHEVTGIVGIGRVITERKKAEEALRESEARFSEFMDHLPAAVFIKDASGKTVFANKYLAELFIRPDWKDKATQELMPPEVAGPMVENDVMVLREGRSLVKEERLIVHGEEKIFETTKFPIRTGDKPPRLGGIAVDITERKRILEALRTSENNLRNITDNVGEGIYVFDAQGKITFMNPEAERLLGWTMAELNEYGAHALIHHRKADGSRLRYADCRMHNVALTGDSYVSMDEIFIRKDGTAFPIAVITTPIREQGTIVASVTAFRDISDRKKSEAERETLIAELQQSLAKVKLLSGLLPICASCKKIRDDKGYWTQIEAYISEHSDAEFSHGLCPDCADKYYTKYGITRK